MKSLNDNPIKKKFIHTFSPDIVNYIESEGFTYGNNNSYCANYESDNYVSDYCYKKFVSSDRYDISVYILENGIGVDFDYNCGGNSSNRFWDFSNYTFEECYDYMVDEINKYK